MTPEFLNNPEAQALIQLCLQSRYIPITPTVKQAESICDPGLEQLYGGAAGGGKSEALLASALLFADVPGYSALILRRTFRDLALSGALMDRSHSWLSNTKAAWNGSDYAWRFPGGARLQFGYIDSERDKYRYQSAEFQFIGVDELTQHPEANYTYMFSRLRRKVDMPIPLRMRTASNPGGVGHDWVKGRFLPDDQDQVRSVLALGRFEREDRVFISAGVADNPHIDLDAYLKNLELLDPLTKAQLLRGDWTARNPGAIFRREWFQIVDEYPGYTHALAPVRSWDLAATEDTGQNNPDWTAGMKMLVDDFGHYWILDLRRIRGAPHRVRALVKETAEEDGKKCRIKMNEDPGQAGKDQMSDYARMLAGWIFEAQRESGSKFVRAQPYAAQVGAGNVSVLRRSWLGAFLDEHEAFQEDEDQYDHDDIVDTGSSAFNKLSAEWRKRRRTRAPAKKKRDGVPDELLENMQQGRRRKKRLPNVYGS